MTLFKTFILHTEIRCNFRCYTLTLVTRPQFSVHKAMKTYFRMVEMRQAKIFEVDAHF